MVNRTSIKANCDVAYGMLIQRATVLFGLFEPGRSKKKGQLSTYALNLARQLHGMPKSMLLSGLCGGFPDCTNVRNSEPIELHLMGFLPGKVTQAVDAGTVMVSNPLAYLKAVAAHALSMRVLMEEMMRRAEKEDHHHIIGNNVALYGQFVYKWFLGSVSRRPNVDLWKRFSPGMVAGQLVVGQVKDQTLHFGEYEAHEGECSVLITHCKERQVYPTPEHFLSIFKTLSRMGEEGAVHGDIRGFNMLFLPGGETVLIDYDFGGWETEESWKAAKSRPELSSSASQEWKAPCYPIGIRLKLQDGGRHSGVAPGALITHNHDLFALASVMKCYEEGNAVWQEAIEAVRDGRPTDELERILKRLPNMELTAREETDLGTGMQKMPTDSPEKKEEPEKK